MRNLVFVAEPGHPGPEDEPLDAYSRVVVSVADRLAPSVANLRVHRRVRGGHRQAGGESGGVVTTDGLVLTSAHAVGVEGAPVERVDDLQRLMTADRIGRTVTVTVVREGRVVPLELVPVELAL